MSQLQHAIRIAGANPIIMVDDSQDDYLIASIMFKRSHLRCDLIHCDSGRALFEYLEGVRNSDYALPALVLMDMNMPEMGGIEAIEVLRSMEAYVDVPLIAMLTSSQDPRDIHRAKQAGANAYFGKPMNPMHYVELFNSLAAAPQALSSLA